MRLERAKVPGMVGEDGEEVRHRRERLGLTQAELGREAGGEDTPIHRNTISAIEEGRSGNRMKMALVVRALDRLEEEAGITAPPPVAAPPTQGEPRPIIVRGRTAAGVEYAVEGPVEDLPELEASLQRLLGGSSGT